MDRLKRSQFVLITLEDLEPADLAELPTGSSLVMTSLLSGQHLLTEADELRRLSLISSSAWTEAEDLQLAGWSSERIATLVSLGILLAERGVSSEVFSKREESLLAAHWPPCAAAFHLLNHYDESQRSASGRVIDTFALEKESDQRAAAFLDSFGPPPNAFFVHPKAGPVEELPLEVPHSPVAKTLLRRRTQRYFQPEFAISLFDLSSLLRMVFAPVASRWLAGKVQLLAKTSPSGGSLHPIEAYPLLLSCKSRNCGIYHYRSDRHGLELLREMPEEVARRWAVHLAQGQAFVGTCSLVILMVARFERNFWKYRERENSYSVVLQDAGHLSQTFQILATDMGLGAFYTAAMNSEAVVSLLGLDYPAMAPVGILGAGRSMREEQDAELQPYEPRRQG